MAKASKFQIGDKLVRFNSLYTIIDIQNRQQNGVSEEILVFEPLHKNTQNETLICTIPASNISKTNIRRPLSDEELEVFFEDLADTTVEELSFKPNAVDKILNENHALDLAKVLKNLWIDKTDESKSFTANKKQLFQIVIKKLSQEVAFVMNITAEEAQAKIIEILEENNDYHYQQI